MSESSEPSNNFDWVEKSGLEKSSSPQQVQVEDLPQVLSVEQQRKQFQDLSSYEEIALHIAEQVGSERVLWKKTHSDSANIEELWEMGVNIDEDELEEVFKAGRNLRGSIDLLEAINNGIDVNTFMSEIYKPDILVSKTEDIREKQEIRQDIEQNIVTGPNLEEIIYENPIFQMFILSYNNIMDSLESGLDRVANNSSEKEYVNASKQPDFTVEQYNKALDLTAGDSQMAKQALRYEGPVELARSALETEFKLDNASEYLSSNSFSEGNLTSEAELILSELDDESRQETIVELVENEELFEDEHGGVTSAWFQPSKEHDYDVLMVRDAETGLNNKIEVYGDFYNKLEDNRGRLTEMIDDVKTELGIENYRLAATNSTMDDRVSGEIEDELLEGYVKQQFA